MKAIKAKCFGVSPTEPVSIFANQVNIVHQINQGRLLLGQLHISAVGQRTFQRSLSGLRSQRVLSPTARAPLLSATLPTTLLGGTFTSPKPSLTTFPEATSLKPAFLEPHWNLPQPKNLSRTHIFKDVFRPVIRVLSIIRFFFCSVKNSSLTILSL